MMLFFFICQRVWKTVKCQGKIREKSGNFVVDDKWQPCLTWFKVCRQNEHISASIFS